MVVNGEVVILNECPFCGENYLLSVQEADAGRFYGQCDRCLSTGPLGGSTKAAVSNWNARPIHGCSASMTSPKRKCWAGSALLGGAEGWQP